MVVLVSLAITRHQNKDHHLDGMYHECLSNENGENFFLTTISSAKDQNQIITPKIRYKYNMALELAIKNIRGNNFFLRNFKIWLYLIF